MPRIDPIPRDEWSDDMVDALSAMQPPTARHFVPPPGGRPDRPKASAIMGTFAHHPDLAKAFFSFNGHILYGTTLSLRQRGILVLRLAAVRQSPYLWAQHLVHTEEAGISEADVSRIAFGPEAPFLDPLESAILRAVDELVLDGAISSGTWALLAQDLTSQQILDLIFTVGCYDMIAWVCGSLEFELEQDLPGR
ncbi:MAG: carboxymuconolactone decarboxylase family protein [Acidimicrobiales bacterium]